MSFKEIYTDIMTKNFPDGRYNDYADKFEILYNELVNFNQKVNLTAVTDEAGACAKHFADSLLIEEYIPEKGENEIVAVFQQGYRMGDKIIRYAMVTVAN